MIKFIEKIFSGLAYQIGKFLFFVLLAIAICFLVDKEKLFDIIGLRVHASSIVWDIKDLNQSYAMSVHNCSSSSTCTTNMTTSSMLIDSNYPIYYLNPNSSIGPSGLEMIYYLNQNLQSGYLYSISTLTCEDVTGISVDANIGINTNVSFGNNYYSNTASTQIDPSNVIYNGKTMLQYGLDFNYCTIHQTIISPKTSGLWLSLHFTRSSVANSGLALIGYKVEELGVYSSNLSSTITNSINQTINSSSATTQESINQLNEEIKEMTSEQQQTNEKLDDLNDKQEQTNQKLDEINGTLTDSDTSENTGNDFFDTSSITSSDGVVSALLTLPIQMASKLVDNLGGTCTPYKMNFGMLGKDYTLNFPCIDLEDYLGTNLWHIIDLLFCGFMAYNIAMLFISIYDSITSLQDYYYSYIYQSSHEEHTRENRRARTPSE